MRKGQEFWRAHVQGWKRSGLSQQAYCGGQRLSLSGLKYWAAKLRSGRPRDNRLVEVTHGMGRAAESGTATTTIELVVEGRYLLRVPAGTTKEHLANVLAAVERRL
jgi:hypothetical protein